jgi:hypothetical protein
MPRYLETNGSVASLSRSYSSRNPHRARWAGLQFNPILKTRLNH